MKLPLYIIAQAPAVTRQAAPDAGNIYRIQPIGQQQREVVPNMSMLPPSVFWGSQPVQQTVPGTPTTPLSRSTLPYHILPNGITVEDQALIERMAEEQYMAAMEKLEKQHYSDALERLLNMSPEQFSLTEAVYLVENAFMGGKINKDEFDKLLEQKAVLVKQILKREKLGTNNNAALNYGLQKLYKKQNLYYDPKAKESFLTPPFSYRFEDYKGEKDYTNVMVTKLLVTNKGQCHSLPLLYLMLAEKLNAKAWVAFAPQHLYIRFSAKGRMYNFETTSGQLVSDNWITQSGYITAKAIKNRLYCDTLNSRKLHNQMLVDLLLGYQEKFGIDTFTAHLHQRILQNNPNDITANILDANQKTRNAIRAIKAAGKPKPADLANYPEAYQAYLTMTEAYNRIDATGYQDMPDEAYQHWLKSIAKEKASQKTREAQQRLEREAHEINKSTLTPLKTNH